MTGAKTKIVTTAEIEVMAAQGQTRRQIAAALSLTPGQVAGAFDRLNKAPLRLEATPEDVRWLRELGAGNGRTPEQEAAALLADLRADDEAEHPPIVRGRQKISRAKGVAA